MIKEFNYNGKARKCVVFHEAKDEDGNVTDFDGIELTYLNEDESKACAEFFKDKEAKPFPAKGTPTEKIEGANADWFKAWRRYKYLKLNM